LALKLRPGIEGWDDIFDLDHTDATAATSSFVAKGILR